MKKPSSLWHRIKHTPFFIKLFNWEYWPMSITNIPLVFIWLFFAIRARSFFFFSSVNPVIETSGFFGESKINIFNRIPDQYIPRTLFIEKEKRFEEASQALAQKRMAFPLIAKPDIGERGLRVKKIKNESNLKQYHQDADFDYLIQDFVDYPVEACILYYRLPGASRGEITSVCVKETLSVKGDGKSTVEELMKEIPRAILQLERFSKEKKDLLKLIPKASEQIELEPIGNHCKGTKFLNGNQYIDQEMVNTFDKIGFEMKDIYYGRFDLKCKSIAALKAGHDFKILEFNGVGSEPGHIYDPAFPLFKKYQVMYQHWKIIYQISEIQKKNGVETMTFSETYRILKNHLKYVSSLEA